MFLIGFIIFVLYIVGLLYAIYWGHNSQRKEFENDPVWHARKLKDNDIKIGKPLKWKDIK